jgi:hypothetical protein
MVILSIMEKRPTIKRLGETRTPPIDALDPCRCGSEDCR